MEVADNLDDKEKNRHLSSLDMTRVKYIYQQTVHKTNDFLLKDIDIDNSSYSENSDYLKVFRWLLSQC